MQVLVKSFIETAQTNFFGKVRQLENAFFDKVVSAAQTELEEFGAGKLDDVSDAAKVMCVMLSLSLILRDTSLSLILSSFLSLILPTSTSLCLSYC